MKDFYKYLFRLKNTLDTYFGYSNATCPICGTDPFLLQEAVEDIAKKAKQQERQRIKRIIKQNIVTDGNIKYIDLDTEGVNELLENI